eukprot:1776810-Alexandrium_andersonii.AAC.1
MNPARLLAKSFLNDPLVMASLRQHSPRPPLLRRLPWPRRRAPPRRPHLLRLQPLQTLGGRPSLPE